MDVLDVAIIAYLVYKILCLVRSTRAENILKGVAIFLVALWLSSPAALNLRGVNYILSHMVEWGVLALIILFQPEIRQLLEKVGSRNIRLLRIFQPGAAVLRAGAGHRPDRGGLHRHGQDPHGGADRVRAEAAAGRDRPQRHHSGRVGVQRTAEEHLLREGPHARRRRYHPAGPDLRRPGACCPLSKNVNLSRDLGMRHRAGIGMSENSDAVVVIVSEETGSISVAIGGMLKRHLMPETLRQLLRNELMPQPEEEPDKPRLSLLELLHAHRKGEQNGNQD